MSYYLPTVIEQTSRGEKAYDLYSRLLKDRIVFIQSAIDDHYANMIIAQLLFLEAEDPEKDVYLYINSPGGYITSGLAIYDTIQHIKCDVQTICLGQAASIGAVLLAAGTKGKRNSLPNGRIMLHQPLGGATGQATDIELHAKELIRMRTLINDILIRHTQQDKERIEKDTERDFFLSAQEAKEYGIIDNVFTPKKEY